ncbi:MAG: hypothetical protein EHM61_16560 [Acidobacteria bacterium]|nr:MAG: hypothetical protein EHM61_16560 [Acidobacteriota bacterium]
MSAAFFADRQRTGSDPAVAVTTAAFQYLSIQTGIGRGGGYKPHLASEILAKFYGDCKDKTNLMRSLLTALKFETYPVSVYASDRNYIRSDWPSPQQFNHAIIAVKVSDRTKLASVVVHPELGHLLLFDPTDEHTPLGDIPQNLQGSLALVGSRDEVARSNPGLPHGGQLHEAHCDCKAGAEWSDERPNFRALGWSGRRQRKVTPHKEDD